MRIADTSALYAAFVAEDAHHAKAKDAMADPEPILVCTEILAETVALLQLRLGFEKARSAGAYLRGLRHVRIDGSSSAVAGTAWAEFERANGKLSLPDAFVVAWCQSERASALAFDKEIIKRAGALA